MLDGIMYYLFPYTRDGDNDFDGLDPQRKYLAFGIPTSWYLKTLGDPTQAPGDPTLWTQCDPQCDSVEYRWNWVFWRWGWRWACTYHVVCVNFICVGHQCNTFSVEYGLKRYVRLDTDWLKQI